MPNATERLLLASIHDVSPRFESEVDELLYLLEPLVGSRMAMLVVPNHWGDAPVVAGSPFASRLRGWADAGIEILLHGYFHRGQAHHASGMDQLRAQFLTAGEGEFLDLSREEAAARIAKGRRLLEDVIGRAIDGFVAPAWLYGRGTVEALSDSRISLAEDHFRVWSPLTGAELARGPVITWASRTQLRLASSLVAAAALRRAPIKVLRIGVHPPDCRHPAIVQSIRKTFAKAAKGRRIGRYSDLLAESAAA